ncbi:ATP-binding cassette sub-family C member Sur [Contarinia nasturtii]|uniref:ATP-binding cassette sub-family C member Sur n=1 Tax=Contarinia nasturtii TaxID=265458 RepID=UPI0012D4B2F5|nr:ATP-binding cassette sub-family C member Sur [Contarinia nasturtii]
MVLFKLCTSGSLDITNLCEIDVINIGSSVIACILLILGIGYILHQNKQRCKTLFYLHNVRSVVQFILFLINTFELAESYLAAAITVDENISISPLQIPYAWMSFALTVLVMAFVRVCEISDKSGYLYLSVLCQIFVFVTKIYKVILLMETLDLNDLRPVLIECTIVGLMLLVLLDSYTIYIESSFTNAVKSTLTPDEHIGYKHSQATFLSKITFYWFTPLILQGYHEPLELEDLGTLHEADTCRTHYDRFHFIYKSFKLGRTLAEQQATKP